MKRDQFIRVLRKECKSHGWDLVVDTRLGKGSHYRLEANGMRTTLKSEDLSEIYMNIVRKQLGLK